MLSSGGGANEVAYLLAVGQGKGHNIEADGAFLVHVPTLTATRAVYITIRFTAEDAILARVRAHGPDESSCHRTHRTGH